MGRGKRREESSEDFISSMPPDIIDSVLSRLTLHEAVRTSILSREWRYKWTSVPNLVFDNQFKRVLRNSKLEDVVYQVLHSHRGPLNKFHLIQRSRPDIDHQWILLLSSSHIQDFTLRPFWGDSKHGIAPAFFSFQHLKHLTLQRCIFKPPPEFKGFSKLATLTLMEVDFVPAIFEQFISQSPLLEAVSLCSCTELDAFEVHGPSLKVFDLNGVFKTICFKKSPVLAEVSLYYDNLKTRPSTGFTYFPPMLGKLCLHPCLLEFSGAGGVPRHFSNSLNILKDLNLTIYVDSIKEIASAFCLARSSPNLQRLSVALRNDFPEPGEDVIEFIRAQEKPDPYLHQLRRVEISYFSGSKADIELIRHLLSSAVGLEEMVIRPCSWSISNRVIKSLKKLPRASPTALVFFEGSGDKYLLQGPTSRGGAREKN